MKTPLRIGAIFGFFMVSAFARLDETESEMVERYGHVRIRTHSAVATPPHRTAGETLVFCVDGWTVSALVIDGRCKGIAYLKPGEWTDEQLWHILETNGGHEQWEELSTASPDLKRQWRRRDQTIAVWQKSQGLQLVSPTVELAREDLSRGNHDVAGLATL